MGVADPLQRFQILQLGHVISRLVQTPTFNHMEHSGLDGPTGPGLKAQSSMLHLIGL